MYTYNIVMRKIVLVLSLILFTSPVMAGSIDPAVYTTVQRQMYRNNYNRQVNYRPMPYWQAQSNYTTRNRMYSDYRSYNNYSNMMRQYNSNLYRGRF